MLAVRIQLRSIPGGWRAAVGHADARPAETDLPEDRIRSAAERIDVLLAPPAVLTTDARRSRDEEEAGVELTRLFDAPEPHAALHSLLGEARGRGETVLLLVDAPEPASRALPWELLGAPSPLEARGDAVIARLVRGNTAPTRDPADRFTVVLASPDPDDALCATRLVELRAALDARGIPHTDTTQSPDGPLVLHLVAHGRVDDAEAQILSPEGSVGAATTAHGLAPWLSRVQLVILDVCDAGNTTAAESSVPGARLVEAGAPAVVAPATRLGLEAARAFAEGLYTGLSAGRTVAESVSDGRRDVRALGRPHPDSRWINPVLHVSGTAAAVQRLKRAGWRPEGWGAQSAEVASLLERARAAATPHGFVGLEHVLAGWPESGGGPWTAHIRYLLAHRPDPRKRLGALRPKADREPDFSGTARLRRLASAADDLETFAHRLWSDLDDTVQALFGIPRGQAEAEIGSTATTLEPGASDPDAPSGPATGLEVLGGPEDGRRFGPGDTIGRSSPDAPGLYGASLLVDPYLSRHALRWESDGPHLLKPAKRRVDEQWVPIQPGRVELRVGDQLALTTATLLRAT